MEKRLGAADMDHVHAVQTARCSIPLRFPSFTTSNDADCVLVPAELLCYAFVPQYHCCRLCIESSHDLRNFGA